MSTTSEHENPQIPGCTGTQSTLFVPNQTISRQVKSLKIFIPFQQIFSPTFHVGFPSVNWCTVLWAGVKNQFIPENYSLVLLSLPPMLAHLLFCRGQGTRNALSFPGLWPNQDLLASRCERCEILFFLFIVSKGLF